MLALSTCAASVPAERMVSIMLRRSSEMFTAGALRTLVPRWAGQMLSVDKYDGAGAEALFKGIIAEHNGGDADLRLDDESRMSLQPKVCVVTSRTTHLDGNIVEDEKQYLFRSYAAPARGAAPDDSGTRAVNVWEAARSTSAAQTFFPPMTASSAEKRGAAQRVVRTKYTYEDGGVHANNPAEVALEEVVALTTGDPKHPWHGRRIGCFVSLGCGRGPRRPASSIVPKVVKKLARIATNTAAVHRKMRRKLHVDDCGGSQPEPCGLEGGRTTWGVQRGYRVQYDTARVVQILVNFGDFLGSFRHFARIWICV